MNVTNVVVFLMIVVRFAAIEAEVKTVEWGRSSDGLREVGQGKAVISLGDLNEVTIPGNRSGHLNHM